MRIATIAFGFIVLAIILLKSGVFDALLMFVIVGAIPSTSLTFSPSTMLAIVVAAVWLTLMQVSLAAIQSIAKRHPSLLSTRHTSPTIRHRLSDRQQ